tara:strand:- start:511 stop:735 length:225 start_codon:yes stop_codon:yes gene_type:complete
MIAIAKRILNSKMIRIYAPSIESKWNAFHIHAKARGKQPGILLGEIFEEYWVSNLEEISEDVHNSANSELLPPK